MISVIDYIEIAVSIEWQTDGQIELARLFSYTVSTNNDTSLCGSFDPTHDSIIPEISHIDSAQLIDNDP